MTSREALLGQGGPWTQLRADWNRLFGTDSSSGSNPFTNPTHLNDGSDTTSADRAADPHASAYVIQKVSLDGTGFFGATSVFPSPVTPGSLLLVKFAFGSSGTPNLTSGNVRLPGGTTARDFTARKTVFDLSATARPLQYATRIATGDEQSLVWGFADFKLELYEIGNAASPAGFEVIFQDQHASSGAKPIGTFSNRGALQLASWIWESTNTDQAVAIPYTQDSQIDGALPAFLAAEATVGDSPSIGSNAYQWAAIAVGITTNAADETSICQADLGAARRVSRIRLLEAADSGTQYAISYSTDGGSTWTAVASPTFATLGGGWQRYDFADVVAQLWRIADNHSPAIPLPLLTWYTWTIEGFPF